MPMQLTEHAKDQDSQEARDTLLLMGGAAMVVFGAGLILSTRMMRRLRGSLNAGSLMQAAIPDFQRYMKLRSM